ncbi:hypothetical protein CBR_g19292 [Chara braunii]|uniref:ENTH domain-containing protein n=1 Tax=Chara braunii TaxID=69332 RepID=A0A388KXH8_CHABU|nr:hypothetical protein CBR_g19292 [Chara braunii]|eukprot:GBG74780.1 hypothetical protein CBR_g19292 [Chara braunii]
MDFVKVFDQTVRQIKREVNKKVLNVPEIEQKVLEATSNEPWGPHGALMADIAQATRNFGEYQMIMAILWRRLNDTGKNWRHVYKSLTVLEYMVAHGAERVIDELREHLYQIKTLVDFQYVESSGKDQGMNVRKKAQAVISLVSDREKIREARQKAASNREKYRGSGSGIHRPGTYGSADRYGGNDRDEDRYYPGYGERQGDRDRDRFDKGSGGDRYGEGGEKYRKDDEHDDRDRGASRGGFGDRDRERDRDTERRGGDRYGDRYDDEGAPGSRPPPSYDEVRGGDGAGGRGGGGGGGGWVDDHEGGSGKEGGGGGGGGSLAAAVARAQRGQGGQTAGGRPDGGGSFFANERGDGGEFDFDPRGRAPEGGGEEEDFFRGTSSLGAANGSSAGGSKGPAGVPNAAEDLFGGFQFQATPVPGAGATGSADPFGGNGRAEGGGDASLFGGGGGVVDGFAASFDSPPAAAGPSGDGGVSGFDAAFGGSAFSAFDATSNASGGVGGSAAATGAGGGEGLASSADLFGGGGRSGVADPFAAPPGQRPPPGSMGADPFSAPTTGGAGAAAAAADPYGADPFSAGGPPSSGPLSGGRTGVTPLGMSAAAPGDPFAAGLPPSSGPSSVGRTGVTPLGMSAGPVDPFGAPGPMSSGPSSVGRTGVAPMGDARPQPSQGGGVDPFGLSAFESAMPATTGLNSTPPTSTGSVGSGSARKQSALLASTLSTGLVNLNLKAATENPLSGLGINFGESSSLIEKEKTDKTMPVSMGRAMGSGTGRGVAGAKTLVPGSSGMGAVGVGAGMVWYGRSENGGFEMSRLMNPSCSKS